MTEHRAVCDAEQTRMTMEQCIRAQIQSINLETIPSFELALPLNSPFDTDESYSEVSGKVVDSVLIIFPLAMAPWPAFYEVTSL